MRIIEFFCGIGGVAAAVDGAAEIVAAVDISRVALDVYTDNWAGPVVAREIETIPSDLLRRWKADLWWLSPPCQPYTCRGKQRDIDDPRARSLLTLIDSVEELQPQYVAIENVPGFATSRACQRLRDVLDRIGYTVQEQLLCPTQLGVPMRRQRFYLTAGLGGLALPQPPSVGEAMTPLQSYLQRDADANPRWLVDPGVCDRYAGALHTIDPSDPSAVADCFTAAYGRSHVRSGSYVKTATGLRRFSPAEIAQLLGFPEQFRMPPHLSIRKAWQLVGNSLSVDVVRRVLPRASTDRCEAP